MITEHDPDVHDQRLPRELVLFPICVPALAEHALKRFRGSLSKSQPHHVENNKRAKYSGSPGYRKPNNASGSRLQHGLTGPLNDWRLSSIPKYDIDHATEWPGAPLRRQRSNMADSAFSSLRNPARLRVTLAP